MTIYDPTLFATPSPTARLIDLEGDFHLEHRGSFSLIWGETYYEERHPMVVFHGTTDVSEANFWVRGYMAGNKDGERTGREAGFLACQAGLRALLGAGSAKDVAALLDAATHAKS